MTLHLLKFILLNNYYVYVLEHEITITFFIIINYIYIQGGPKVSHPPKF